MITGSQLQRLQMTRWHGVVQPGRGLSTITVSFRVGGINLGPLFGENGEDSYIDSFFCEHRCPLNICKQTSIHIDIYIYVHV